ncbi:unnamed protein product [Danaus chrysippus]|uniref:(African queen) hypothetical protein n=1 Tax=Danaus chrysippus TaxID=151541 RepID=A0A8J2VQ54_9NEOP|nr:unnamed protein product [Danaus chrysippus]
MLFLPSGGGELEGVGESRRGGGGGYVEEGAGDVHTRAAGQVPGARHLRSRTDSRYGWWSGQRVYSEDTGLLAPPRHRITDSAWLKERLRVLAADYGLKRR